MREDGLEIPSPVQRLLDRARRASTNAAKEKRIILISHRANTKGFRLVRASGPESLKEQTRVIKKNAAASLIDIGDGVACLEFHSKMNAIGADTISMMNYSVKEVVENSKRW